MFDVQKKIYGFKKQMQVDKASEFRKLKFFMFF